MPFSHCQLYITFSASPPSACCQGLPQARQLCCCLPVSAGCALDGCPALVWTFAQAAPALICCLCVQVKLGDLLSRNVTSLNDLGGPTPFENLQVGGSHRRSAAPCYVLCSWGAATKLCWLSCSCTDAWHTSPVELLRLECAIRHTRASTVQRAPVEHQPFWRRLCRRRPIPSWQRMSAPSSAASGARPTPTSQPALRRASSMRRRRAPPLPLPLVLSSPFLPPQICQGSGHHTAATYIGNVALSP